MRTFIRELSRRSVLEKICVWTTMVLVFGIMITGIVLVPIAFFAYVVGLAVCIVVAYGICVLLDMFMF